MSFQALSRALIAALLALSAPSALAGESQFAAAAEHYRNARWQQACEAFQQLLAVDPQIDRRADAHFYFGEALVQLGRWAEAGPQFTRVLELEPDGPRAAQAQFRAGESAYMTGDDATAQRLLAQFHERYADNPLNAYALAYLGGLALDSDQFAAAERWFAQSLEQFPSGPMTIESAFGLAQAEHLAGHLEQARQAYARVAETASELAAPALLQIGAIDNARGAHTEALAAFEQFSAKFADSDLLDKVQLGRGYALLELGRTREAEQTFAALADEPRVQTEASYYLALTQAAEGNWQQAAATLGQLAIPADHALAPAIAFHRADALAHTGAADQARAAFDRVLAEFPDSTWADDSLLGKLRLAVESQEASAALDLAEQMLDRYPDSPLAAQARLAKGQALNLLDKPAEAAAALRELANVDPINHPELTELRDRAQGLLAVSQAKLGQFAEAQNALQDLAKRTDTAALVDEVKVRVGELAQAAGEAPLAQELLSGAAQGATPLVERAKSSLAWNHFEAGRWQEAAAAFDQLLAGTPDGPLAAEAALLKARALEHLEQPADARALYEELTRKYPQTKRAAEAWMYLARLAEQRGDTAAAASSYAKLFNEYPEFAGVDEALYRAAWILRQTDPAESQRLFERLHSEFATSEFAAEATLRLAESALDQQQWDAATELLREISRPDAPPDIRPQALYLEGRLEMSRGQWLAAERPLEQLAREHADHELALPAEYLLAEAAYRRGEFDPALARLDALLAKAATSPDAWVPTAHLRRAQTLASLRRWDEAAEQAASIARQFPHFAQQYEADYLSGRAAAALANFDEARAWYARVLENPAAADTETAALAQWMTAESYFHQKQYRQALAEYLKVSDRFPRWHEAALVQAGKAAEASGQQADAARHYEDALARYPQGPLSGEASRRLEATRGRAAGTQPSFQ